MNASAGYGSRDHLRCAFAVGLAVCALGAQAGTLYSAQASLSSGFACSAGGGVTSNGETDIAGGALGALSGACPDGGVASASASANGLSLGVQASTSRATAGGPDEVDDLGGNSSAAASLVVDDFLFTGPSDRVMAYFRVRFSGATNGSLGNGPQNALIATHGGLALDARIELGDVSRLQSDIVVDSSGFSSSRDDFGLFEDGANVPHYDRIFDLLTPVTVNGGFTTLRLSLVAEAHGAGGLNDGYDFAIDFLNTMELIPFADGTLFGLADGYTVNSASLGLVDNQRVTAVPLPASAWLLPVPAAAALKRRRRLPAAFRLPY